MISSVQWEKPRYSKKQIDKAGKILIDTKSSDQERNEALIILNNWRSSHAYPLHVIVDNLYRNNKNSIVVQRLKRLDSIEDKLKRFSGMSLYRMQDLGGCRVIVNSIDDVYESIMRYKNSNVRHILKREDDYIRNPKESGYRSYHMVYQFQSDDNDTYNKNMLIEIQFRTQLQHIWATALETMGIYFKCNLKSGMGEIDILRFFTLVSSLYALWESTPVCPNTSDREKELKKEISEIDNRNNIISRLEVINQAMHRIQNDKNINKKNGYYLLDLNYDKQQLNILSFKTSDLEIAYNEYSKIENKNMRQKSTDAVLVSAKSFDDLKEAYPNYFVDISKFIDTIQAASSSLNKFIQDMHERKN